MHCHSKTTRIRMARILLCDFTIVPPQSYPETDPEPPWELLFPRFDERSCQGPAVDHVSPIRSRTMAVERVCAGRVHLRKRCYATAMKPEMAIHHV